MSVLSQFGKRRSYRLVALALGSLLFTGSAFAETTDEPVEVAPEPPEAEVEEPSAEVESAGEAEPVEEGDEAEAADEAEPLEEEQAVEGSGDDPSHAGADEEALEVFAGPLVIDAAEGGEYEDGVDDVPMDVTVNGTPITRTAGSAHIVKEADLERFEYDDAGAVLQQVPGTYVRQEDGIGLRPNIGIRGVNPDRSKKLTLMEDGILFGPAPYSAPAAYYFPLMTRVTAVRVIKGPAAISYGPQTVGGAIDLMTRDIPSQRKGMLDIGLGEYGYAKAHGHIGASGENFGFLIEGVHLHNNGFKSLPNGANTGSTRNEWMAKSSYVLDPNASVWNEFSIKLSYSDEVSNETYLGLTDADFRRNPYQRYAASSLDQLKSHRTGLVLSHLVDSPRHALQVRTSVYRQDLDRSWTKLNGFRGASVFNILRHPEDPGYAGYYDILTGAADSSSAGEIMLIGPNARTYVSQGIQSVLTARPTTGPIDHRVEFGLRLHNDSIQRRHSESGYEMIGGQLVSDGNAEAITSANIAESYALAAHITDAISWKNLTLTPGVRLELIRSSVDDYVTGESKSGFVHAVMPGLGAFYGITDNVGVLGGVHRGFSPPAPASESHVEPEYSINYEAGARYSSKGARIELIGFLNDYSNLTDICTLASGCVTEDLDRQFDAGEARIYGFEAYAGHDIPIGQFKLPVMVAYTMTHARFDNSFQSQDPIYGDVESGDEIPYVPRHQLGMSVGFEGKFGGGIVGVNYVSPMREEAGKGPMSEAMHTDEQFLVDLGARLRVYGPILVYGNVRNLLDARHIVSRRPYGARPNAPRWIQVGAKVDF